MRHPTEATLRRLIDEPAGVADHDRAHVADCAACQAALSWVMYIWSFMTYHCTRSSA